MNRKRKLSHEVSYIAYVAGSIDGRISKSSRSKIDWTSKEDWNFFQQSLKKFDVVVVGHNTYRMAKIQLKRRNTIVFTSKMNKPKLLDSVFFFNPKKYNFKKFIDSKNYKKIAILGGPKVYNFFLEHKMLNELFVTIEPCVFTTGVPMFSGNKFRKYKFFLQSVKRLNKKGTILLKYKNAN
ncbi:MAG: dihydrofolate reductase [Patescibacteria group bacterium]